MFVFLRHKRIFNLLTKYKTKYFSNEFQEFNINFCVKFLCSW